MKFSSAVQVQKSFRDSGEGIYYAMELSNISFFYIYASLYAVNCSSTYLHFFLFFLSLFFYRLCTAGYVLYAGVSYKGENMVLRSVTLGNSPFLH